MVLDQRFRLDRLVNSKDWCSHLIIVHFQDIWSYLNCQMLLFGVEPERNHQMVTLLNQLFALYISHIVLILGEHQIMAGRPFTSQNFLNRIYMFNQVGA